MTPEVCPNCGADVPPGAKACPECGSDETTAWSDEADTGGLDLPDDEFNYDEYVKEEFGGRSKETSTIRGLRTAIIVILVAALFILIIIYSIATMRPPWNG